MNCRELRWADLAGSPGVRPGLRGATPQPDPLTLLRQVVLVPCVATATAAASSVSGASVHRQQHRPPIRVGIVVVTSETAIVPKISRILERPQVFATIFVVGAWGRRIVCISPVRIQLGQAGIIIIIAFSVVISPALIRVCCLRQTRRDISVIPPNDNRVPTRGRRASA